MSDLIVHLARRTDWAEAQQTGSYAPPGLAVEGFIHLSRPNQVERPANEFFANEPDLILLWVAPSRLEADLRYEPVEPDGEEFPHLYGTLNVSAVVATQPLAPWPPGGFRLPGRPPIV